MASHPSERYESNKQEKDKKIKSRQPCGLYDFAHYFLGLYNIILSVAPLRATVLDEISLLSDLAFLGSAYYCFALGGNYSRAKNTSSIIGIHGPHHEREKCGNLLL